MTDPRTDTEALLAAARRAFIDRWGGVAASDMDYIIGLLAPTERFRLERDGDGARFYVDGVLAFVGTTPRMDAPAPTDRERALEAALPTNPWTFFMSIAAWRCYSCGGESYNRTPGDDVPADHLPDCKWLAAQPGAPEAAS